MNLTEIELNKPVLIIDNNTTGFINERLKSFGVIPNNIITKVNIGKKSKISIYEVNHMLVALRSKETDQIWIKEI